MYLDYYFKAKKKLNFKDYVNINLKTSLLLTNVQIGKKKLT